jgi:hypothetical protein
MPIAACATGSILKQPVKQWLQFNMDLITVF